MILVVEDDPDISQLISEILKMRGYSFLCAQNGLEALQIMEKNTFDLVLMDVQMPVLNGLETVQIIRDREKKNGHRTPVIAVTSHSRHDCLSVGMDDYVSKPISFDRLLKAVALYVKPSYEAPAGKSFPSDSVKPEAEAVSAFNEICLGDQELAKEFLQLLLDDYPIHVEAINRNLNHKDPASLSETLHKLKGSVSNLLVPGVDDLVSQLKEKAERKDYGEAERILAQMEGLFNSFIGSIQSPGTMY